ncbi:protealysin inhibitor emfourin [Salinisphaera sp. Q1T1-3]|uniref:protealysin inhibitor emfourin n=1 Tax=Salinisphaera sp. Q1T1-3 TaxID=2321229 RepID=UPI000E707906|nr:protealysin inhibitor emfourin [Salinisphaera sp. Q1T1-3]RJS93090.1 hypothetical protein D3260_09325 [Salinisphaera sp. Q1T1-3]
MSGDDVLASTTAWLWVAREGGLVAAPGLARPRQIALSDCTDIERARIGRLIGDCRRLSGRAARNTADQRYFRIVLGRVPDEPVEELCIPEPDAPDALSMLWSDGPR